MTLVALAGGALGVACLLAGRFVGAVSAPLFNVNGVSPRQARASGALIGRVNATFQFIEWGTLPVGSQLGGLIGAALGVRVALDVAAVCGIVSAVWIHLSPARRLTMLAEMEAASDLGSPAGSGQPGQDDEQEVPRGEDDGRTGHPGHIPMNGHMHHSAFGETYPA